jgi:rhomboid family GlyGly-CTERM serine protease
MQPLDSVNGSLARLTDLRWREWRLPVAICVLLIALHAGGPGLTLALRYERDAAAHEWWRLLTGHLVHADAAHLVWNLLGVLLVWWLFASQYTPKAWLAILVASTVAVDAGFLLWMPRLDWYVGFSGVLHGLMAAGLLAWLVRSRDPLTALVAVLFAAKLAWEHLVGPLPFTAESIGLPVIHQAHSFGALGGLAMGAWMLRRRVAQRAPL